LNIEKEYECDVVVCGRGVSGFAAAVAVRNGVTAKKIPPQPLKKRKRSCQKSSSGDWKALAEDLFFEFFFSQRKNLTPRVFCAILI